VIKVIKKQSGHLEISEDGENIEDCLNEMFKQSSSVSILIGENHFIYIRMSEFLWDKGLISDIKYSIESNAFGKEYKNVLFKEIPIILEKLLKLSPML
jgi:hypothetical protein